MPAQLPSLTLSTLIVLTALSLTACDGGDSKKKPLKDEMVTPTSGLPTAGVYVGSAVIGNEATTDIFGLIDPAGRYTIYQNGDSFVTGDFSVSPEGALSGETTSTYFNGIEQRHVKRSTSLTGKVIDEATLEVSVQLDNQPVTVRLRRDAETSLSDITMAMLAGTLSDTQSNIRSQFTINADGSMSGNDVTGCIFEGSVSIPAEQYSLINVQYSAANCGNVNVATGVDRNGEYRAQGIRDTSGNSMFFIGHGANVPMSFIGKK